MNGSPSVFQSAPALSRASAADPRAVPLRTEIDMDEAAHFRCRKTLPLRLEPALQFCGRRIVGSGFAVDQKIHFLCQPPPNDRVTVAKTQPLGFPHQRFFLYILVDNLLPVLAGGEASCRAGPDFFQPVDLGRADNNGPALLALPGVPEMVQADQQQPDQDKMRDRITEYLHAIFPVRSDRRHIPDG